MLELKVSHKGSVLVLGGEGYEITSTSLLVSQSQLGNFWQHNKQIVCPHLKRVIGHSPKNQYELTVGKNFVRHSK